MTKSQPKAAGRAQKAAELRAAQARSERKRRLLMIGGVAAVFVLIVGGAITVTLLNQDEVDAPSAGADSEYGVTIGEEGADHEVVIYEDFLCPICGQLEGASNDGLTQAAADGKVLVEYRPIAILTQFGDYSVRSANAFRVVLEEAGPQEAKEFHDLLFENQPEEGGPYPSDDDLVGWAVEAGADEAAVRDGIESLEHEDWVQDATDAAVDAGVQGTPTVLLDGEVFQDGRSWTDIGQNLVEAVE